MASYVIKLGICSLRLVSYVYVGTGSIVSVGWYTCCVFRNGENHICCIVYTIMVIMSYTLRGGGSTTIGSWMFLCFYFVVLFCCLCSSLRFHLMCIMLLYDDWDEKLCYAEGLVRHTLWSVGSPVVYRWSPFGDVGLLEAGVIGGL